MNKLKIDFNRYLREVPHVLDVSGIVCLKKTKQIEYKMCLYIRLSNAVQLTKKQTYKNFFPFQ